MIHISFLLQEGGFEGLQENRHNHVDYITFRSRKIGAFRMARLDRTHEFLA